MGGEEASLIDVTGSISRKLLQLCCWDVPPTYSKVVILVGAVQILVDPPILLLRVAESWCPSALLMQDALVWDMLRLHPCVQQ
jgi:hypothetical protein